MQSVKHKSVVKYFLLPLLVSIYPVVFLYAYNQDMLSMRQLFLPLSFALLLAVFFLGSFSLIMRSILKGSLAAACSLLIFWNYDLIFQVIRAVISMRERYILLFIALILLLLIVLIWRAKKIERLEIISTVMLVMASFLILINLVTIIPGEVIKQRAMAGQAEMQQNSEANLALKTGGPDFYLLMFDEYARLDTIEAEWGYDNSAFREHLRNEAFFIADKSKVKHPATVRTMPELLNLEYFRPDLSEAELVALYYNNLLYSFFNERGYDLYFLDGYNHPLKRNIPPYVVTVSYADIYRSDDSFLNDAFSALLFSRTIASPFEHRLGIDQRGALFYYGNKGFFDLLKNSIPLEESPKFIFAHINTPHLPYVFDRDGNFTDNKTHFYEHERYSREELKEMYLEQYIYATAVMKDIIKAIKAQSEDVIIIIQSDHGPRPSSAGNSDLKDAYKVFNAIYFPDGDYSLLSEDISPVNTMRVVLNQFFGEELELLE